MKVREWIVELLDLNMDADLDIEIKTTEESFSTSDISIESYKNYVTLEIETKDYVLVDKRDFEEMKDRLEELENNKEE